MKKALLFGETFSPNLGDGVISECLQYLFKERGFQIQTVDLAHRTRFSTNNFHTKRSSFWRIIKSLVRKWKFLCPLLSSIKWNITSNKIIQKEWVNFIDQADCVIIGGGQLLTDRCFGFPPKINSISKIVSSTPLMFCACGVGKHWGYFARKIYKNILRKASYVSCRDKQSLKRLQPFLNTQVALFYDPAFLTGKVYGDSDLPLLRKTIGLGIQHHKTIKSHIPDFTKMNYYHLLKEIYIQISSKGVNVEIFTNGSPEDHEEALAFCDYLKLNVYDKNISVAERPLYPKDLVNTIKTYRGVVATRLHAGIIAYALGIPIVPIVWDEKVVDVWESSDPQQIVLGKDYFLMKKVLPDLLLLLESKQNDKRLEKICEEIYLSADKIIETICQKQKR